MNRFKSIKLSRVDWYTSLLRTEARIPACNLFTLQNREGSQARHGITWPSSSRDHLVPRTEQCTVPRRRSGRGRGWRAVQRRPWNGGYSGSEFGSVPPPEHGPVSSEPASLGSAADPTPAQVTDRPAHSPTAVDTW